MCTSITINGNNGDDTIHGSEYGDVINGGSGNDKLTGGSGDDSLVGGSGDDTYLFATATTAEADTVAEAPSAGTDTLSFSTLTTDVMLSLETSIVQTVHANRSLKLNAGSVFEEIVGGSGNDTFTGNLLANTLTGNAGNDTLTGGGGNDSLVGGSGDDNYVFRTATTLEADTVAEAANAGTDRLSFSSLTTDVILGLETSLVQSVHANRTLKLNAASVFEVIVGGSGNDTLTGNSLANTLTGNAGNDLLTGNGGDDSLAGGSGDDTYVFGTATTGEADTVTEAANGGTDTLSFSSLKTDVILSVETTAVQSVHANRTLKLNTIDVLENIVGGSGNDTLTGNSLANILVGNAGGDTLNGGGGRDILIGGPGLDTLNGGEDEDILIAGRTTSDAVFSKLNLLLAEWVSVNSYTTRISNLRASVGAPAVSLKAKVNVLNDAGEDDSLVGGNGTDWYFRALDDVVTGLVTGEIMDIL
jgi:serralysin